MYLIIGASSFIGGYIYNYCKDSGIEVYGTYCKHQKNADWINFDINTDNLYDLWKENLSGKIPEAVIVCGANTSIDDCKRNEKKSSQLNVLNTKRILRQAKEWNIKCVFLSSEAVFDGERGMYIEEDLPNPVTLYGSQKLQVEQYIFQEFNNYLIFRVSRAVGSHYGEKDIFDEFYNKIIRQEEITCLKDQRFCITEAEDIAKCIVKALLKDMSGLYHISSNNYISRYELAVLYAERMFGGYGKIVEKEYDSIPFVDNRHIRGGLKGDKLAALLGIHFMNTAEILDRYISTYERERHE